MIRDARVEDAPEIVELFRIILTDMELPIMEKVAWNRLKPALVYAAQKDNYKKSFKNAVVKEVDGEIAGFCFGYDGALSDEVNNPVDESLKKFKLPAFESDTDNETFSGEWYLDSLVTKQTFRGKGIGKELMEAAYEKARQEGMTVIGLNVDQGNPKARKLYEREGFEKTGELVLGSHPYDHMQKELNKDM